MPSALWHRNCQRRTFWTHLLTSKSINLLSQRPVTLHAPNTLSHPRIRPAALVPELRKPTIRVLMHPVTPTSRNNSLLVVIVFLTALSESNRGRLESRITALRQDRMEPVYQQVCTRCAWCYCQNTPATGGKLLRTFWAYLQRHFTPSC